MSDQEAGSGRATVALVSEKVDGLRALTEAGFSNLQRQINAVAGLPVAVAKLATRIEALERDRESQRIHWPTFLISVAAVVVALLAIIVQH